MYSNSSLNQILENLDLGSGIAEEDNLLEATRLDTPVLADLLNDRVDLVPGNKGSGKSALYRIMVEFLPAMLLTNKKVVIAHGVSRHGDPIFSAFKEEFEQLSESDFVDFWCIYLISLAHEQFIKSEIYLDKLKVCEKEINEFRKACERAKIPEIKSQKSLIEILQWTLNSVRIVKGKLKYNLRTGDTALTLFGDSVSEKQVKSEQSITYAIGIKECLEKILRKCDLSMWLMVDRLDEIFPRRSELEGKALRGLLKTIRIFSSDEIRVKVFLRDDMLDNLVSGKEGFTALTHLTARKSDTLRWNEDQLLRLIVQRLCNSEELVKNYNIDKERISSSKSYREKVFYELFPAKVHKGEKQSTTLKWVYNRCQDGNGVVTPRDVIQLLNYAKQRQCSIVSSDLAGESLFLFSSISLRYGHKELSKSKKVNLLQAEYPHLFPKMEKFAKGKSEYSQNALKKLLGRKWEKSVADLHSIGFLQKTKLKGKITYKVPYIYSVGLEITRGKA